MSPTKFVYFIFLFAVSHNFGKYFEFCAIFVKLAVEASYFTSKKNVWMQFLHEKNYFLIFVEHFIIFGREF